VEITNPGRTVRVERLEEGLWYWTVEARGANGLISVAEPRQFRVLSVPLLPAPENLSPPGGYNLGIEQLKVQRSIDFSWSAVPGANSYTVTIFQQIDNRQRQVLQSARENRTSWTLDNLKDLSPGTFVWQVEALNRSQDGAILQRGRPGESTFVIDIPLPAVQVNRPGVLYGSE
jgi:hypothetical protein